jgi:hypothetical protein
MIMHTLDHRELRGAAGRAASQSKNSTPPVIL